MTKQELNEQIARYLGWRPEGDFHPGEEDQWEGWRDNEGQQGYSGVPDFINILECFVPALDKLFDQN